MALTQDELAIENMELKAQLHEIKTALGITQDYGSESTPLKRIAEFNKMRESVRDALDINGAYFISNETSAMISVIADLKNQHKSEDYWREMYKSAIDDLNLLKSNYSTANESLRNVADRLMLDRFEDELVAYRIEQLINGADVAAKQDLLSVAHSLELGYFNKDEVLCAIANLKHSLQLSQNEIDELQEKAAIADQLQSDLINTDIGEIRSERDYYRGILDKLCDRLNVPNIEALEHAAKYQEMDLDFTAQYNDDLRGKLVTSQAMNLGYLNRIVELENEVRSLKEPLPERDRLTNAELIQLVKNLLKQV